MGLQHNSQGNFYSMNPLILVRVWVDGMDTSGNIEIGKVGRTTNVSGLNGVDGWRASQSVTMACMGIIT